MRVSDCRSMPCVSQTTKAATTRKTIIGHVGREAAYLLANAMLKTIVASRKMAKAAVTARSVSRNVVMASSMPK